MPRSGYARSLGKAIYALSPDSENLAEAQVTMRVIKESAYGMKRRKIMANMIYFCAGRSSKLIAGIQGQDPRVTCLDPPPGAPPPSSRACRRATTWIPIQYDGSLVFGNRGVMADVKLPLEFTDGGFALRLFILSSGLVNPSQRYPGTA